MDTIKTRAAIEEAADRAFAAAYSAAGGNAREGIAAARKFMKLAALAPHIAARAGTGGNNVPLVLHHWVTLRCNASCEQCLWKDNSAPQMVTDEIKRFYEDAAGAGILGVLIGGGEPQMRPDIAEIYRFAKRECGFKVGTATNGAYLEKRIDEFGEFIDTMIVSLDSADPEKHDRIRCVPGLFDKAVAGIRAVKDRFPFIHLFINCCLDDNSAGEVDDLLSLAATLDVPISFDVISTVQHVAGQGTVDKKGHLIESYGAMSAALAKVAAAKRAGAKIFNSNHYLTHFDGGKKQYACRYPKIYLRVMPNGDVEDCMQVGNPIGNVLQSSVKDIIASTRMAEFRRNAEKCWTCSSPTMVDGSYFFDNPAKLLRELFPA